MKHRLMAAFTGLSVLAWGGVALAQQGGYGRPGWQHPMNWWGGWFGGPGMLLFWILIAVLVILGIRWAVKGRSDSNPSSPPRTDSAVEVLRRRYASGEIDRDTYREMKGELESV